MYVLILYIVHTHNHYLCELILTLYFYQVHVEMEHIYTEQSEEMKSKAVVIKLKPPLELINQLPYPVTITLNVSYCELSVIYIKKYNNS